jgi:hypothetical protein
MAHATAREQVSMICCGRRWVGVDRAHCCRRTAGCGHVFDDVALWDRHRRRGRAGWSSRCAMLLLRGRGGLVVGAVGLTRR